MPKSIVLGSGVSIALSPCIAVFVGTFLSFGVSVSSALADDLDKQAAAVQVITKAATDICYTVLQEGSHSETRLSGDVSAELDKTIFKIAGLGIKGAGEFKTDEYRGVLQRELAETLKSSINCREDVFGKLVNKMLGLRAPASQSTIMQIAAFVDEGEQISNTFIKTNNPDMVKAQFEEWSLHVESFLNETLDPSYAIQFRSAQPINTVQDGMNFVGSGTWQNLKGRIIVLNQFLTELRRTN